MKDNTSTNIATKYFICFFAGNFRVRYFVHLEHYALWIFVIPGTEIQAIRNKFTCSKDRCVLVVDLKMIATLRCIVIHRSSRESYSLESFQMYCQNIQCGNGKTAIKM
ncbi:hypothetical protein CEXT_84391 [Caerostris extrusa]|uniref:Uncharacterized protein n=1 Tax=Caerostris extrusa TaxID=172846 RepID=A0AAV4UWN7_CAEEX|nr:hypothetical protein CEXT_84391 [Caerostris extrusa]